MAKYKLGDLIDVTRGMSLPGDKYAESGNLIRLTLGNFNLQGNGFKPNTSKTDIYFMGSVKKEFIMKKGDIITPLTEQTYGLLGSTARIPESGKYIQSQDVALIRSKSDKLYEDFCYYLISSPFVRKQLGAAAQQTKIRHTSPDKIKDCEVIIPEDVNQQIKITNLLNTIENKIALNNKTNTELENMAKTIYDYWFTQFDFPDKNGHPYKTSGGQMVYNETLKREIPAGWEVGKLNDLLLVLKDGTHNPPKRVDNGIPLLTGTMFGKTFLDYSQATFISKEDYNQIHSQYQPNSGDIILTKIGTLGNVNYLRNKDIPIAIHCNSALLRFNKPYNNSFALLMCKSDLFYSRLRAVKGQSIQEFVSLDKIANIEIEIPDYKVVEQFNIKMNSYLQEIERLQNENEELTKLRDYLLPLLMNGQIEVR